MNHTVPVQASRTSRSAVWHPRPFRNPCDRSENDGPGRHAHAHRESFDAPRLPNLVAVVEDDLENAQRRPQDTRRHDSVSIYKDEDIARRLSRACVTSRRDLAPVAIKG